MMRGFWTLLIRAIWVFIIIYLPMGSMYISMLMFWLWISVPMDPVHGGRLLMHRWFEIKGNHLLFHFVLHGFRETLVISAWYNYHTVIQFSWVFHLLPFTLLFVMWPFFRFEIRNWVFFRGLGRGPKKVWPRLDLTWFGFVCWSGIFFCLRDHDMLHECILFCVGVVHCRWLDACFLLGLKTQVWQNTPKPEMGVCFYKVSCGGTGHCTLHWNAETTYTYTMFHHISSYFIMFHMFPPTKIKHQNWFNWCKHLFFAWINWLGCAVVSLGAASRRGQGHPGCGWGSPGSKGSPGTRRGGMSRKSGRTCFIQYLG